MWRNRFVIVSSKSHYRPIHYTLFPDILDIISYLSGADLSSPVILLNTLEFNALIALRLSTYTYIKSQGAKRKLVKFHSPSYKSHMDKGRYNVCSVYPI